MHLEKKRTNNINNKNIVNVIINTSKSKTGHKKASSGQESYQSSESVPFSSSANLQHEILRQTLQSPQINRPPNPDFKIRENNGGSDSFIDEGSAMPPVDLNNDLNNDFSYDEFPMKSTPLKRVLYKPKRSYKDERASLKSEYIRLGGNNPIILNSTRKKTIQNAIKELQG